MFKPHVTMAIFGMLLLLTLTGIAEAGPMSALYLTSSQQGRIEVVRGNNIVNTFAISRGEEYPIAVRGTVRTAGSVAGETGAEYSLGGTPTGAVYGNIGGAKDGTTNGIHNYAVDYEDGNVVQTRLDWSSPVVLFNTGGAYDRLGITYDAANNSLWVSGWTRRTIVDYSLAGTLLRSFSAPVGYIAGLAYDPADGTLWFGTQSDYGNPRTLYQFSTSGAELSTAQYAGLAHDNFLGGEFAPPGTVSADPHFTTFDGEHYDFQGLGEFTLARSTVAGDPFDVQMETRPYHPGRPAAIISEVAAMLCGRRASFDLDRAKAGESFVWLDGQPTSLSRDDPFLALDGCSISELSPNSWEAVWDTGEIVDVTATGDRYLNVSSWYSPFLGPDSVEGLLTSSANPEAWRVDATASLFAAAVPEPATLTLLGLALIGFGVIRRRMTAPEAR